MLASCPQDLFFNNNSNNSNDHKDKRSRHFHHQSLRKDSMMSTSSDLMVGLNANDMSNNINNNNNKDKEEQVWPPDVESAFVEALESIPKLGRRKILVNGKPCGRNELISDFIYRKTCKIRTRKQVSSHIQVLKNTRKGDSHFMRLLTDSVDNDDSNNASTTTSAAAKPKTRPSHPHHPMHMPNHHHHPLQHHPMGVKMKTYRSIDSLSSDDSSINSSPSPTDYIFDIMYNDQQQQQQVLSMLQFKNVYDPMQQSLLATANSMNPLDLNLMTDPFFGSTTANNTDILTTPLLEEEQQLAITAAEQELLINSLDMLKDKSTTDITTSSCLKRKSLHGEEQEQYPLWPNYLCLYLEYALPYDPSCRPLSHNLSQLPHCHATGIPSVSSKETISKEKCPIISTLASLNTLMAKTKLDLNLSIADFAFNNTSFFETKTRRTIECTTTIYSFGNVVLESKEVQQALWVNEGKYMYSFVFVNQFFDAFMKGIRSLQSWDEVDIAINNLCIVQSFEDVDSKADPLLVMVYEFERGNGVMEVSSLEDDKPSQQVSNKDEADDLDFLDHDL
ncbi:NAD-dependent histone deacetylase sir2 [Mucor velutinosus]|uniref:NAD-dependent histone deacetylase sir2 n=1 Tax=Mucor velutinosus TaxID=708070 RepID=A0AAN7DGR7_9FUNG|nr:NAD-dependent histone deacetylase sir2 [Mucor velutinosus]